MRAAYEVMFRKMTALGMTAAVIGLLSACAAPSSYMGIALTPGIAAPEVQALAARARDGDKRAQLELGVRFEEGNGVARDANRARKLYRAAAATSGGTIWIYSPPVGNGTSGRVIPVNAGPKQRGLAEARVRLEGLEISRRSKNSVILILN